MKRLGSMGLVVAVVFSFLVGGCSQKSPTEPDMAPELGKMIFAMDAADEIASGTVTVTKGSQTFQLGVTIADHSGSVTFEGLQVGHWNILVQLYDSDLVEIYTGDGSAVVHTGQTTSVTIHVNHNTGNLEINVVVPGGPTAYEGDITYRNAFTGVTRIDMPGGTSSHYLDGSTSGGAHNYRGGSLVLYSGWHPNAPHDGVWLANIDGTNQHRLDLPQLRSPRWSWTGHKFAVNTLAGQIAVLNPDGSNMIDLGVDGINPIWTPDNRIIYNDGDSLKVMNQDGSNQQTIISGLDNPIPSDCSETFEVLYHCGPGSNLDVYKIPLSGGTPTPLATEPVCEASANFNYYGTQIVYEHDLHNSKEIYTMDADGGNKTQFTNDGDQDEAPFFLF
jgi:Domain of unknown function (DUF5050)